MKTSSHNNLYLKAGNIEKDATSDTEIVNWRSMVGSVATSVSVSSAGAPGERLLANGDATANGDVVLRALVPGSFIGITETDDELIISGAAGAGGEATDFNTVGGAFSLLQGIGTVNDPGPVISLKTLVPGDNISFVATNDVIEIVSSGGAGAGTVETFTSPAGTSLLQGGATSVSTPVVRLRSLLAGEGITLLPADGTGDTITISANSGSGGGSLTAITSVGDQKSLLFGGATSSTGPAITLRTLLQGTNITLTENAQFITIASAAGVGSGTVARFDATGFTPVGATTLLDGGVFTQSGATIDLKTLRAGNNITFTTDANTLTINANATSTAGAARIDANDFELIVDPVNPTNINIAFLPRDFYFVDIDAARTRNSYDGRNRLVGATRSSSQRRLQDALNPDQRRLSIINNDGDFSPNEVTGGVTVNGNNLQFRMEVSVRALYELRVPGNPNAWVNISLIAGVEDLNRSTCRNEIVDSSTTLLKTNRRYLPGSPTPIDDGEIPNSNYFWLRGKFVIDNFRIQDGGAGIEYLFQGGDEIQPYLQSHVEIVNDFSVSREDMKAYLIQPFLDFTVTKY